MDDIRRSLARQGLCRSREERLLGGVCAGLGQRFGIEPWPARLLVLVLLVVLPGSPLILYPVLWYMLPLAAPATGSTYGPPPNGAW